MGTIVKGKITKIMPFGAFVAVEGGGSGMIHISEVSASYVKDIKEFLSEGQEIEAAVVSSDENGRISLSLKRMPQKAVQTGGGDPPDDFYRASKESDPSLEGMISRFKSISDDKMGDLKRGYDGKRGKNAKRTRH